MQCAQARLNRTTLHHYAREWHASVVDHHGSTTGVSYADKVINAHTAHTLECHTGVASLGRIRDPNELIYRPTSGLKSEPATSVSKANKIIEPSIRKRHDPQLLSNCALVSLSCSSPPTAPGHCKRQLLGHERVKQGTLFGRKRNLRGRAAMLLCPVCRHPDVQQTLVLTWPCAAPSIRTGCQVVCRPLNCCQNPFDRDDRVCHDLSPPRRCSSHAQIMWVFGRVRTYFGQHGKISTKSSKPIRMVRTPSLSGPLGYCASSDTVASLRSAFSRRSVSSWKDGVRDIVSAAAAMTSLQATTSEVTWLVSTDRRASYHRMVRSCDAGTPLPECPGPYSPWEIPREVACPDVPPAATSKNRVTSNSEVTECS